MADDSENRSSSSEQKHAEAADCDGALSVYDSTQLPVHSELCSPIQHDNGECLKNNEPGRHVGGALSRTLLTVERNSRRVIPSKAISPSQSFRTKHLI